MKILVLPKYGRLGASSRLRLYQYLPYFRASGILTDVYPLLDDRYLRALYKGRRALKPVVSGYLKRIARLLTSNTYDAVLSEQDVLPWLPSWIELALVGSSTSLIIDCDDAVFHRYDKHNSPFVRKFLGRKIDRLMEHSRLVTAGNDYLAQRARSAGCRNVEHVPTVVDLARYSVGDNTSPAGLPVVIGWIGSPATAPYLSLVESALRTVSSRFAIRCIAIGARKEQLLDSHFEAHPWSEQSEVASIQMFDVGIMPLPDLPFERGKCGYKLIQYMACGVAVVASPVGANSEIVLDEESGFLADSTSEWITCLMRLVEDSTLRRKMGLAGRSRVEQGFSLQVEGPRLSRMVQTLARGD